MTERIHHGQNIKRFREMLNLKQDALAHELGEDWNQKKISCTGPLNSWTKLGNQFSHLNLGYDGKISQEFLR